MPAIAEPRSVLATRPADRVRQRVVSADFHVCSCESAVRWLEQAASLARQQHAARYVCVANVTDVMDAHRDPDYSSALRDSHLTVPDGKPVVWALRSMGHPIRDNVRGSDLMREALENEAIARRRHVLVGGTAEAREGVKRRFPNVQWLSDIDFRFDQLDDEGYARLAAEYAAADPDYAWVSLGGGKQVRFMHRFTPLAGRGVLLGVGAAFDFHAGLIPEAPLWVRKRGFEWLYRLLSEPRRLWRRYLVHNPPFLYHWARVLCLGRPPEPVISGEVGAASPPGGVDVLPSPDGLSALGGGSARPGREARRWDQPAPPTPSGATPRRPVSLVVPMFNESECVDHLLKSLSRLQALLGGGYELEFVLVDDGSDDGTADLIDEAITGRPGYRLVRHGQNRGVAAAIFTGITEARHPTVASIDSDGSYDLSLLEHMLPMTSEAVPMVTASPYHPLGGVDGAPPWRVWLSRTASRLYARFMPCRLDCYTSCFRTYHRERVLNCRPTNDGFTGITELAWRVIRGGAEVREYPAVLHSRVAGVSKMRVARTIAAHVLLLSRIAVASFRDRLLGPPKTAAATPAAAQPQDTSPTGR